eukprot:15469425-Heterocapsa_arctica.AAC.1
MPARGLMKEVPPPRPLLSRTGWKAQFCNRTPRKRFRTKRPTAALEGPAAAGRRAVPRREEISPGPRWELS